MNWNCVHIEIFEIFELESGKKDFKSIFANAGLDPEEHETLETMVSSLVQKIRGKKPTLAPTGECKVYQFNDCSLGEEDQGLLGSLTTPETMEKFSSYARVLAGKYIHSPKSRRGLLIVINADIEFKKHFSPHLLVFKSDFQPGFMPDENNINIQENLILPELKKGFIYPYFDGTNYMFHQVKVNQKSSSDYFHRMLRVNVLPSNLDIEEECLLERLDEMNPGAYEKYFRLPEEDRRSKREVLGPSRIVQDDDQLQMDQAAMVAKKTQVGLVDNNCKPSKIKLQIDDGIKFEAKADQLNSSFFVAQDGMEKFIIIRAKKVETKGAFNALEFSKTESLDDVVQSLKFDSSEVFNV